MMREMMDLQFVNQPGNHEERSPQMTDPHDQEIEHWSEFDRGGHFPAMEVPDVLVGDVRRFFRTLR